MPKILSHYIAPTVHHLSLITSSTVYQPKTENTALGGGNPLPDIQSAKVGAKFLSEVLRANNYLPLL